MNNAESFQMARVMACKICPFVFFLVHIAFLFLYLCEMGRYCRTRSGALLLRTSLPTYVVMLLGLALFSPNVYSSPFLLPPSSSSSSSGTVFLFFGSFLQTLVLFFLSLHNMWKPRLSDRKEFQGAKKKIILR
jgi:hypothetical protein